MTKLRIREELIRLRDHIGAASGPVSVNEILLALPEFGRRTLIRRLNSLVKEGVILRQGTGRTTRYLIAGKASGGENLRSYVQQALTRRRPVSYRREFLDAYKPNATYYLADKTRKYLLNKGRQGFDQRPAGTFAKDLFGRFLIDLSWNSSRLEGNTYSLLDTKKLIEEGLSAEGRDNTETQMILNHKEAIIFLLENIDHLAFNTYTVCNLHALLSDGLLGDPRYSGRLRERPVGIAGSSYTPIAIPALIHELFELILLKASAILDPIEQSFFVAIHLPYLQPFVDVNKRVSRFACNIPLIKQNLCPLSFIDVPDDEYINGLIAVYELNRTELFEEVFVWAYERSCQEYEVAKGYLQMPSKVFSKYRQEIKLLVREIVVECLPQEEWKQRVEEFSVKNIDADNRLAFNETIANELGALFIGNIARYSLTPEAFERWQARSREKS